MKLVANAANEQYLDGLFTSLGGKDKAGVRDLDGPARAPGSRPAAPRSITRAPGALDIAQALQELG